MPLEKAGSRALDASLQGSFTLPVLLCPCHSPDAADSTSFDVQLGDIILTATDGLFDNMPDYMILQELKKLKVMTRRLVVGRGQELRCAASLLSPLPWPCWFGKDSFLNFRK